MFKNIVYHWTAGNYKPSSHDKKYYHFLIDGEGNIHKGNFNPKDNEKIIGNNYAAHCGGGNTGRIGIAVCCMRDINTKPTQIQIKKLCSLGAELCLLYGLTPKDCITHAMFGLLHPNTSSAGKIDINIIPYENITGIEKCNSYLQQKTQGYYNEFKNGKRKRTIQ